MESPLYPVLHVLFDQVAAHPQGMPIVPLEQFAPESNERRLLDEFQVMLARLQSSPALDSPEERPRAAAHPDRINSAEPTERERFEETVLQLAAIVESSDDAIIGRTPDGTIISWNAGAERIYGYQAAEIIGRPISILFPPDRANEAQEFSDQIARGEGVHHFETERTRKDGTRIYVSVTISPIKEASGKVIGASAIARDITERKKAEEALRVSEERYRAVSELVSDYAYALRVVPGEKEKIEWSTAAVSRITGYTLEELEARGGWAALVTAEDKEIEAEHFSRLFAGEPDVREFRIVTRDGATRWLRFHGRPVVEANGGLTRIYGAIEDITEEAQARHLLEQRVAERTRELSTLLQVSQNVVSTLELKPLLGLILDQLRSGVDYTSAAILIPDGLDLRFLDYRGPISPEGLLQFHFPLRQEGPFQEVMRRREPVVVDDLQGDAPRALSFRSSYGERLGAAFSHLRSWMGIPMIVKDRVIGMLSIGHGQPGYYSAQHVKLALAIGNQAAVAIENARLYEGAQSVAMLEERQRLARELHDSVLQTIYGIQLGVQTARELLPTNPDQVGDPLAYVLELAKAAMAEMRALIFELRPESLQSEGLIAGLDKQAVSLRTRHKIRVDCDFCAEPDVELNVKEAVYRIAQEALHNTVKHAHAQRIALALRLEANYLVIDVTDDGVGFDPAAIYPGHLGLLSMRERVERLAGILEIVSAPGKGTRVRARIPDAVRPDFAGPPARVSPY